MVSVAPQELPSQIGRYLMFRAFALGGMASVHLGRLTGPAGFSRVVALKLLHPVYAAKREYYTMLLDEARLSSRIAHPNVVQTLDVVQDGAKLCIVMEYVHGVSLAGAINGVVKLRERVPPPIAASILVGVLHGLHAAHEARGEDGTPLGIVHRDISPQNIVVGVDGVARVLDFGVAKALRKEQVTREGHVKGKIAYMAPEQLSGAPVTRQADVRAAGVVLWETLACARLFDDENEARLIARVLGEEVPPPSRVAPDIPAGLDDVVLRATAFDKRARFGTAAEMAEALAAVVPPASPPEVAAWVERVAGDQLDVRAKLVRDAEAFAGTPPGAAARTPGAAPGAETDGPAASPDTSAVFTGGTLPAARSVRARRAAFGAAVALGVAAAAVALVGFARRPPSSAQNSWPTGVPPAVPTQTQTESSPPDPFLAAGTVSSQATDGHPEDTGGSASGNGAGAHGARSKSHSPESHAPESHARPAAQLRSAGARAGCDPPFSIDSQGMKHYKASCLP